MADHHVGLVVSFQEFVHPVLNEEAEVVEVLADPRRRTEWNTHKNAPPTPKGREAMVRSMIEGGLMKAAVALQFHVSAKTSPSRSSASARKALMACAIAPPLPAPCAEAEALRRQRHTGKQIATGVGISPATVSRILRRLGLNRLRNLEPAEPAPRYEREHPGKLIHIDIKKARQAQPV